MLAISDEQDWQLFRLPQDAGCRRCPMAVPEARKVCLCRLLEVSMSMAGGMNQSESQPKACWLLRQEASAGIMYWQRMVCAHLCLAHFDEAHGLDGGLHECILLIARQALGQAQAGCDVEGLPHGEGWQERLRLQSHAGTLSFGGTGVTFPWAGTG